jgi:aconitase B
MSYRKFKMPELKREFGLEEKRSRLFSDILPIEPSQWLRITLQAGQKMPIVSEKAKSEFIVAPILTELCLRTNQAFGVYSGAMLNVDAKRNLNGECDFILSDKNTLFLESSIVALVEAKKDNIEEAVPQCSAQMLAARIFNGNDENQAIYGCVTNTNEWQFLKLDKKTIIIDRDTYYLHIVGQYVDLPELAAEPILT